MNNHPSNETNRSYPNKQMDSRSQFVATSHIFGGEEDTG
jgi:hypothetical protein